MLSLGRHIRPRWVAELSLTEVCSWCHRCWSRARLCGGIHSTLRSAFPKAIDPDAQRHLSPVEVEQGLQQGSIPCGVLPYNVDMAEKTARLDLRLTEPQRQLIEQAAEISGSTLAGFAVSQLMDAATEIVARSRSLVLDRQDWDIFVAALEAPGGQAWDGLKAFTPVWDR